MAVVAANRTQDTAGTLLPIETESNPATSMDRQVVVVGDPATASKAKVSTLGEVTVATLDTVASASLTAAAQTVALALQGDSAGAVQVTGTFVGTMQIEGTVDGTNWVTINGVAAGQTFPSPLITAPGLYRCTPGGLAQFRVNMTAFTSGTAVVSLRASDGTGGTFVTQILGTRISDGTTNVGIKPASTAAVAADPAIPVALHPSSPLPTGTNALGSVTVTGTPPTDPSDRAARLLGVISAGPNLIGRLGPQSSATGTITAPAITAASTTLLPTNTARLGYKLSNDSNVDVLVSESSAATSAAAYSYRLQSGGYFEWTNGAVVYTGALTMLGVIAGTTTAAAAAAGGIRVTELT